MRTRSREINRVRRAISRAIDNGELVRPRLCQVCKTDVKVCAIPQDATNPLRSIVWICHRCLYAERSEQNLLSRLTRGPALAGSPSDRVMCQGWVKGRPCKQRGRYVRVDGPWKVCGKHRTPKAEGPWKGR